jgi:hypothetical protein
MGDDKLPNQNHRRNQQKLTNRRPAFRLADAIYLNRQQESNKAFGP